MSNVHMIGAPRKAGRRRERPLPNVLLADILTLPARRDGHRETAEEEIERSRKAISEAAYYLVKVVEALERGR